MANPELLGQIRQFAASGQGSESTKNILVASGWKKAEVEEAIIELGGEEFFSKQQRAAASVLRPRVIDVQIKKSRWKIWVMATVGVAAILGGAVYAFYLYPRSESSEVILSSAINNLIEARSFRYDTKGKIDFNISGVSSSLKFLGLNLGQIIEKGNSSTLVFDAGGYSSFPSDGQPRISMEVNAKVSGDKLPEISASWEALEVGESVYFKVTRTGGGIGFFESTPIEDQWVKDGFSKGSSWALPLTVDKRKVFNELLNESRFLTVKEKLSDENIEGVPAYHFRLNVDQKTFWEFLESWFDLASSESLGGPSQGSSLRGAANGWKVKSQEMEFSGNIEMWVEKDKNVPIRILANVKIKDEKGGWNTGLNWDTFYSKFNEPTAGFEEPSNAKPKVDWEKDFSRVLDDRRVLNLKGIRVLVEAYRKKCGFYPGPENCIGGFKAAPADWTKLLEVLKKSGLEDDRFKTDFDSDSIYQYGSDGRYYFMGVTLSSARYPALKENIHGNALGVHCDYTVFCLFSG